MKALFEFAAQITQKQDLSTRLESTGNFSRAPFFIYLFIFFMVLHRKERQLLPSVGSSFKLTFPLFGIHAPNCEIRFKLDPLEMAFGYSEHTLNVSVSAV